MDKAWGSPIQHVTDVNACGPVAKNEPKSTNAAVMGSDWSNITIGRRNEVEGRKAQDHSNKGGTTRGVLRVRAQDCTRIHDQQCDLHLSSAMTIYSLYIFDRSVQPPSPPSLQRETYDARTSRTDTASASTTKTGIDPGSPNQQPQVVSSLQSANPFPRRP